MATSRASSESRPDSQPPSTAPAIDGGAIQANRRQLIRPARMCVSAAASAATPEMPMFAPAPAAGELATRSDGGKPEVAQHGAREAATQGPQKAPQAEGDELERGHGRLQSGAALSENHSH